MLAPVAAVAVFSTKKITKHVVETYLSARRLKNGSIAKPIVSIASRTGVLARGDGEHGSDGLIAQLRGSMLGTCKAWAGLGISATWTGLLVSSARVAASDSGFGRVTVLSTVALSRRGLSAGRLIICSLYLASAWRLNSPLKTVRG